MTNSTFLPSESLDFSRIAANLTHGDDGIWYANQTTRISYPEDQHAECFALEDSSYWFRHRAHCIVAAMQRFPPPGPLYDIGGGNGHVSLTVQSMGVPAILVEPGEEGAANAKRRGVEHVICSTLQDAGFLPRTIPAIGLFDVLEHIEDDCGFLTDLHKTLIPGGRIYITVPAYNLLWSAEDMAAGHFRRYTLRQLHSLLSSTGFVVEYRTYFFTLLPLPIMFVRSIPSRLGMRTTRKHDRNWREHMQPTGSAGGFLTSVFSREVDAIRRGKLLPVGGSCLMVASANG